MIKGIAAVFFNGKDETQFKMGKRFVERIMPEAFNNVISKRDDVAALFNHNPDNLLGRVSAGTLRLRTDSVGLHYEITPSETSVYRDVESMQDRGDLRGSSFGFVATKESIVREGRQMVRQIEEVALLDVGPVTYPAYAATGAGGDGANVRCVTCDGHCETLPEDVQQRAVKHLMLQWECDPKVRSRLIELDLLG